VRQSRSYCLQNLAPKAEIFLTHSQMVWGASESVDLTRGHHLKGTYAQDLHSMFLIFLKHLSITNKIQNTEQPTFSKIFLKFTQIFEIFDHSPF
jgi:hypothetical protein